MDTNTWQQLTDIAFDLFGSLVYWPVSLSLLGLTAAMIGARLARGRGWGWHAALGLIVAGMLVVPWLAMLDEEQWEYVNEEDEAQSCMCPTTPGCGVPAALDSMPGWGEVS